MKTDKQIELEKKYTFQTDYLKDINDFKKNLFEKKIIPYQVEFQPTPRGKKICWLECPYCYGLAADDNGERLDKERGLEILKQILDGGVRKIIFAGYATDPLNCSYIDDLLDLTISKNAVFGFNTKALKVSDKFCEVLKSNKLIESSYISLSVDAGSHETYNKIHAVKGKARIYDNVLRNAKRLGDIRQKNYFDLSAAYLVNIHSGNEYDCEKFINEFRDAGCNLLRFTFPQQPKGIKTEDGVIPTEGEKNNYKNILEKLKTKYENSKCSILVVDADTDHDIYDKPRTVPCYARYLFPTVGFDGWLYNCSQSSAPNFRSAALGDLNKKDFWDLYYDYDSNDFKNFVNTCAKKIGNSGCRCDRKEHVLNQKIIDEKII
ncbi:radical SAM protein [Candidatus Pelagibacter sp.]|nr:radical SAM protein [Candidatus Pelagibacter sp.]